MEVEKFLVNKYGERAAKVSAVTGNGETETYFGAIDDIKHVQHSLREMIGGKYASVYDIILLTNYDSFEPYDGSRYFVTDEWYEDYQNLDKTLTLQDVFEELDATDEYWEGAA